MRQQSKRTGTRPARPRKLSKPDHNPVTLGDLLTNMGPELLSILVAPLGLDVAAKEPVTYDSVDEPPIHAGNLVLAVSIRPDSKEANDLVATAGACNASAVVFKQRPGLDVLAEAARSANVALIATPQDVTWDQVSALLKRAIASGGRINEGPGDVPMADLFTLANAVAAMVGGPVTIQDPQSSVLAFSTLDDPVDQHRRNTILRRRVSDRCIKILNDEGVFRSLSKSDDPVEVNLPIKGYRKRLAIAVRAGTEVLGSIWVAESKHPLGEEAKNALREAARIAALHLVRHRVSHDLDRRMRSDLLRSLLEGRGSVDVLASKLSLEPKSRFTVVAFGVQTRDEAELALHHERLLNFISIYCETFRRPATCLSIDRTIFALLPTSKRSEVLRLAQGIVPQTAAALGVALHVGIGSTVSHLRDVTRSRSEADQMLQVLGENGQGRTIADIEELGAHTILLELKNLNTVNSHLHSGKLSRLIEHDAKHGTRYVATLQAYLEAFGDVRQAASVMNVHPNTVKYRIGRLTEVSGIDLSDATERLVIEIALRLL